MTLLSTTFVYFDSTYDLSWRVHEDSHAHLRAYVLFFDLLFTHSGEFEQTYIFIQQEM